MPTITGKIRGNGRQLASYWLTQGENESIRILYVDGQSDFDEKSLRTLLGDFSLNELLTKSRQGIYHATINPEANDARSMTDADWLRAAEILAEELGFANQRRAVALHLKYERWHAHIALERYNHQTGKMIPIAHNYKKQDRARAKIEQEFSQQPTPRRNPNRPAMKAALTELWHETTDATTFIRKAKQQGYMVSKGYDRKPFMVVDSTGRSFNLVRHLEGINTNDVRTRFKDTVLMEEREAIAFMRSRQIITNEQPRQQIESDRQTFLNTLKQKRNNQPTHKPRMH